MTPKSFGWIPLFGNFDVSSAEEIVFHGGKVLVPPEGSLPGAEPIERPAVGLLSSSHVLGDGDLSADIVFEDVTNESVCELAVIYDSNANHIVAAGLGGASDSLFSVREYGGPRTERRNRWFYYQGRGDRSALKAGVQYHVEASFRGSAVAMKINGVRVATAEVGSPPHPARQAGLFCNDFHRIDIRNFKVDSIKPKAFVVMQFGSHYDEVYTDVIRNVCKAYEVNVIRADEVAGPGVILADIVREISAAQLVIADITPINANVYFEVGYALALRKPTLLLAKKGTALPFDIAGFRVLFYEDTIGGKSKLEEGLRRHLAVIASLGN